MKKKQQKMTAKSQMEMNNNTEELNAFSTIVRNICLTILGIILVGVVIACLNSGNNRPCGKCGYCCCGYGYEVKDSIANYLKPETKTIFNENYEYPEMGEILQYLWCIDDVKYIKPINYITRTQNKIEFMANYLYDNSPQECRVITKKIIAEKGEYGWAPKSIQVIDGEIYKDNERELAYNKLGLEYKNQSKKTYPSSSTKPKQRQQQKQRKRAVGDNNRWRQQNNYYWKKGEINNYGKKDNNATNYFEFRNVIPNDFYRW